MKQGFIRAFVQARMTSSRFPGKVLALLHEKPLLGHVVSRVASVSGNDAVIVLTSEDASDDPIAAYADTLGVQVFRGPLDDVFERFRLCAGENPCEWILRISADSPAISPLLLRRVIDGADTSADVVTTIHPRTFPKGQNAELIRTAALLAVDSSLLTEDDREHVTPFFYRNDGRYRIRAITSGHPDLAELSFAVDTPEDLARLERETALAEFERLAFA